MDRGLAGTLMKGGSGGWDGVGFGRYWWGERQAALAWRLPKGLRHISKKRKHLQTEPPTPLCRAIWSRQDAER